MMLGSGFPAIITAKNATATIPIVMANVGANPVAYGLVESLARPVGNVIGTANLGVLLSGKRVELLKQMLPALTRLAMVQVWRVREIPAMSQRSSLSRGP